MPYCNVHQPRPASQIKRSKNDSGRHAERCVRRGPCHVPKFPPTPQAELLRLGFVLNHESGVVPPRARLISFGCAVVYVPRNTFPEPFGQGPRLKRC